MMKTDISIFKNMKATRDTLMRERKQVPRKDRLSRLLRAVQNRASASEKKELMSGLSVTKLGTLMAHLSYDVIFRILLLLPAESLYRLSFVCKTWFNIINSSNFIEAHSHRSETVLIFLQSVSQARPKTFYIESKLGLPEQQTIFPTIARSYINFLEVQDGKGKVIESNVSGFEDILATCNGLILAKCQRNGGLLVMNPVTRKLVALPLGTICPRGESYGFIFSHLTKEYKVVHLFQDDSTYISCEILSLTTRSWRAVDGPSFGLFRRLVCKPVAAIGALNWLPATDGCTYLVSMGTDDEKFQTRNLPINSSVNDRLVEIQGFLSFVTHVTLHRIEVWILKGLQDGEWVKQHNIWSYSATDLLPICTLRYGREMFFKSYRDSLFYTYDIDINLLKKVEMEGETPVLNRGSYLLPHVNTIASWVSLGALW